MWLRGALTTEGAALLLRCKELNSAPTGPKIPASGKTMVGSGQGTGSLTTLLGDVIHNYLYQLIYLRAWLTIPAVARPS